MIETLLTVLPLVFLYLLVGIVVAIPLGGRDPLDFAGPRVVLGWPVVLFVAAVALLLMPSEPEVENRG